MNVASLLLKAKKRISSLDAELILLDILGEKDRSVLILKENFILSDVQVADFEEKVSQRERGVPLAYILGKKEFFGREFFVSPEVLVPRVETESIIEFSKEISPAPERILDVGTGSGCIAISLKLEMPTAEVFGVDISKSALEISERNAKNLGAEVKFFESNLLEKVEGKFDLIVANLPYVSRDWEWVSGIEFEPEIALFAEDGGLYLIKKLIREAKDRTKYLILESDTSQQTEIIRFAEKNGFSLVKKDDFISVFSQK